MVNDSNSEVKKEPGTAGGDGWILQKKSKS